MIGNKRLWPGWLWLLCGMLLASAAAGQSGSCTLDLRRVNAVATPVESMRLQGGGLSESGGRMELHWSGCPVSAATYQSALLDLMGLRAGAQAVLATTLADRAGQQRSYRWVIGEGPSFGLSRTADGVEERFVPVRMTAPEVISRNLTEAFAGTGFVPARVVGVSLEVPAGSQVALEQLSYGAEMGNQVRVRNDRLEVNGHPIFVIRQFFEHSTDISPSKLVAIYDRMRNDLRSNAVDIPWQASWDPRLHTYNFDGARQQARLAYSRGLFAMPDLGEPPDTSEYKSANHRMIGADGRPHPWAVSFCDPAVHAAHAEYLTAVISAFKQSPATLGWYTGDEYAWPSENKGLYSYDPSCLQGFRNWLHKKYGSLQRLDQAWHRDYQSWPDVQPPREREFNRRFADWQHFRRAVLRRYFHRLYVLIHREDPDHPVWPTLYTYLNSHNNWGVNWRSLASWWDLVPEVDVVTRGISSDSNDTRGALLDQIALADGKAVVQTMHVWGSDYTKTLTEPLTVAQVFHGSFAGVSYWAFGGTHLPLDQCMFNMQTLSPIEPWYRYVGMTDQLLLQLAPLLQGLQVPPAPVGILVTDLSSLYGVNLAPVAGTVNLFRDLQIPVQFISERNLPDLAKCRVLVIGDEAKVWPARMSAAIQNYLSTGGRLLVNGDPAVRGSENQWLKGARLRAVQKLLGARQRTKEGLKKRPHIWVSDQGKILRLKFSLDGYTPLGASPHATEQRSLDNLRLLVTRFLESAGITPMVQFAPYFRPPRSEVAVKSEETEVAAKSSVKPTLQVLYLVGRTREIVALMNYYGSPVKGALKVRVPAGQYVVSPVPGVQRQEIYSAQELAKGVSEKIPGRGVTLLQIARQSP